MCREDSAHVRLSHTTLGHVSGVIWTDVAAVLVLGVVAINAATIALLARVEEPVSDTASGLPLGALIPEFRCVDVRGQAVTDKDVLGKLVLFLGTRCSACPDVARQVREASASERALILVVVANRGEDVTKIEMMRELTDLPGLVVVDDESRLVVERLAVPGVPFAYAIDRTGHVRAKRAVRSLETLRATARATKLVA